MVGRLIVGFLCRLGRLGRRHYLSGQSGSRRLVRLGSLGFRRVGLCDHRGCCSPNQTKHFVNNLILLLSHHTACLTVLRNSSPYVLLSRLCLLVLHCLSYCRCAYLLQSSVWCNLCH